MMIATGAARVVVPLLHVRLHSEAPPQGHPVFLQRLQLVYPRLGPAVRSIPLHWQQEGLCPRGQCTLEIAADDTFCACTRPHVMPCATDVSPAIHLELGQLFSSPAESGKLSPMGALGGHPSSSARCWLLLLSPVADPDPSLSKARAGSPAQCRCHQRVGSGVDISHPSHQQILSLSIATT